MCWVAIDRGHPARAASARSPRRWRAGTRCGTRSIGTSSRASGIPTRRAFVQTPGATTLDAAALLMPLVRFVSPTDPRWISTLRAIEQRAGERLARLSLSPRRRILRRAHGRGGHVLDVLLLVRRVSLAHGRSAQGAVLLREDAGLRQPPGALRRRARARRRSTSATSRRRSRTSRSSAPPSISTAGSRPPATPGEPQASRTPNRLVAGLGY